MIPVLVVVTSLLYPAVETARVLGDEQGDAVRHWLAYWCVYAVYQLCGPARWLATWLVPYFDVFELLGFLYLVRGGGAGAVYDRLLKDRLFAAPWLQSGVDGTRALVAWSGTLWSAPAEAMQQATDAAQQVRAQLDEHPELRDTTRALAKYLTPVQQAAALGVEFFRILVGKVPIDDTAAGREKAD